MISLKKFNIGDKILIISFVGISVPGEVVSHYIPTNLEHPADPHHRYKIKCKDDKIIDVSENESDA